MKFKEFLEASTQLRAGIIPYIWDQNGLHLHLMIPSNASFGGTSPQIAKGRVEKGEDVQETAVREGEEELGLKRSNFAGPVIFIGQVPIVGQEENYTFYCYAVQVKNINDFNKPHYETGWAGWLTEADALSKVKNKQKNLLLAAINKIKQSHQGG